MEFNEYVAKRRNAIYRRITDYIPLQEPEEHYKIVREYIDRQGNYRRPILLMLTGEMFGAPMERLVQLAAAQQLSEEWLLIQDDAMDDSEFRRGGPALHKMYGWIHAINASDTINVTMWKILKDYIMKIDPQNGDAIYDKFYDMIKYTIEGQYIENKFINNTKDLSQASESMYFRIADGKTCYYTIYGPMQIGAMAAGAPADAVSAFKEIGSNTGIAFQIMDDILDMAGDEKTFGKKRYGDLYEGKLTLIILHAYGKASPEERKKIDAIYRKSRSEKTSEEIAWLAEIIKKYGGVEYAMKVADHYGELAEKALQDKMGLFPDNEYKNILKSAIQAQYKRKS